MAEKRSRNVLQDTLEVIITFLFYKKCSKSLDVTYLVICNVPEHFFFYSKVHMIQGSRATQSRELIVKNVYDA